MAIGMKQQLKLQQSLVMTPQLQQAIKLLQLSRLELENLVTTEMTENPMLEESQDDHGDEEIKGDDRAAKEGNEKIVDGEVTFDWQNYVESFNPSMPVSRVRGQDEQVPYESVTTRTTDLVEHLQWQVQMSRM